MEFGSTREVSSMDWMEGMGMLFFVVFGMFMLGLMCFNIFTKTMKRSRKDHKLELHVYTKFLVNLLQEIGNSHDKGILTNQCLVCAKSFQKYDSADVDAGLPSEALRFGCGHIYHRGCLDRIVSFKCLCCIESMNSTTYAKSMNENYQNVSEIDLYRFIDNLHLIYTQGELKDFVDNYPDSRASFENAFTVSFERKYGITADVQYPSFQGKDKYVSY